MAKEIEKLESTLNELLNKDFDKVVDIHNSISVRRGEHFNYIYQNIEDFISKYKLNGERFLSVLNLDSVKELDDFKLHKLDADGEEIKEMISWANFKSVDGLKEKFFFNPLQMENATVDNHPINTQDLAKYIIENDLQKEFDLDVKKDNKFTLRMR